MGYSGLKIKRNSLMTSTVDNWFNVEKIDSGIYLIREPGHVQSFLVKGEKRSVLIDTGMGFCDIKELAAALATTPVTVLNTHWHFDHIGGNACFDHIGISELEARQLTRPVSNSQLMSTYLDDCIRMGVPLPEKFVSARYTIQSPEPQFYLNDGDIIDLGGRCLTVFATPGHTRGSMSFLDDRTGCFFCGDFLYDGTLYAHFEDSDLDAYMESLEKVLKIETRITRLCVGHNQPVIPPQFARAALRAFEKIASGALDGQAVKEFQVPVDVYQDQGITILLKRKGQEGVELFK